jgi:glycosyltransferase involved in cell wall biosynthesis
LRHFSANILTPSRYAPGTIARPIRFNDLLVMASRGERANKACNRCLTKDAPSVTSGGPVRVALVHPHFSRSSSLERDSVLLATGLVSHGIDVHVYCDPSTRTAEVPDVTFHDVSPIRVGRGPASSRFGHPLERGSFAVAATHALRRDRHLYDVVDVRQAGAWEHDVVTVHGVIAAMQHRWPSEAGRSFRAARLRARAAPVVHPQIAVYRAIQAQQFRSGRFRRVIAVTEQVLDDVESSFGVPSSLIDVVPPPIDLSRLRASRPTGLRARLGLSADTPLVLFVGHNFQRKALDKVVEAIVGVPEAHLVVVGDGDRSGVMPSTRDEEIAARVHFVGRVEDPERFYAESDVFALPTRSDPWGIPLIEAMAAGVAVITTSIAGAAGVVAQAEAGIVLPNESMPGLREALVALIRDPMRRRAMGERGRVAAERFGAESHAGDVLQTYRKALADAHPRRGRQLVS